MPVIGTVESLWRYPVKSMRGEELAQLFVSYAGVYGDRLFAFGCSASRPGLPFLTAREQNQLLRYQPRFRDPLKAAQPVNLSEAEKLGANPVSAQSSEMMVDVRTPDGRTLAIDDPRLIQELREGSDIQDALSLLRSDKAMTDAAPVSIISLQTVRSIGEEIGLTIDRRRFRANIYLDLQDSTGFAEDAFVGKSLAIGSKVIVRLLKRDGRCMITTLDPETAEKTPAVLKTIAQKHGGKAGIYAAVLEEGIVRRGDLVELV